MSKLTKLLAQAAIVAVAGTWGTSLAHASITYSLVNDVGGGSTLDLAGATSGSVVLDLIANISTTTGTNGVVYTSGNINGIYAGSDKGTVSNVSVGSLFSAGLGISQAGLANTVAGTNGSVNWGDTTSTGLGNAFLAYSPNVSGDGHAVTPVLVDGSGNVLLGKVTYAINSITAGDTISLAFSLKKPGSNSAAALWVEGTTPLTNVAVTDTSSHTTVIGATSSVAFKVVSVPVVSGPNQSNGVSGDWNTASTWTQNVPASTDTALFDASKVTAPISVGVNTATTIATINFNTANAVTVNGTGPLTVSSAITLNAGSHIISAPIKTGGDVTISAPGLGTLTTGAINNTGHTLTIASNANVTATALTGAGNLAVAGTMTISSTTLARNDTGAVIELGGLNLTGTLDVTNHDMIIHFDPAVISDSDAFYQVQNWIYNGLTGSTSYGNGGVLTSSTEGSNKWLQLLDNAVAQAGSFDNVTLSDTNEILVKYTYQGDVNWDGVVDYNDYNYIDGQISVPVDPLLGTLSGDVNLDGVVDYNDYNFIDGGAGNGTGGLLGDPLHGVGSPVAVPEPASLSLLVLSAGMLLGRKNRK